MREVLNHTRFQPWCSAGWEEYAFSHILLTIQDLTIYMHVCTSAAVQVKSVSGGLLLEINLYDARNADPCNLVGCHRLLTIFYSSDITPRRLR